MIKNNDKVSKKSSKPLNYEAAQFLGLNDMEIMDFINPDRSNTDRYIL